MFIFGLKKLQSFQFQCIFVNIDFPISMTSFFSYSLSLILCLISTAGFASFNNIDLTANIETIGVIVDGISLPNSANLSYRISGETSWHNGHELTLIDGNKLAGSLFNLQANTIYEIKVQDMTDQIIGSTTTQPEQLSFSPLQTIYVNAGATSGGNGMINSPYQTIQQAINIASPGTSVLVANGTYHEQLTIMTSGTENFWIQLKAIGDDVTLDGSTSLSAGNWTPLPGQVNVWTYEVDDDLDHFYLARDDSEQYYRYPDLESLYDGVGLSDTPMSEGWYMEPGSTTLYMRSATDPSTHSWQLPNLDYGIIANQKDWIWIEGFNIKYFGSSEQGRGILFNNSSNIVIRNNTLRNNIQGIEIYWDGNYTQGNNTRIEYNNISDAPVDSWPWSAVKNSTAETSAIILNGHKQIIVRNNELHHAFNGIYAGRWGDLENSGLNIDIDVYQNNIHHIGDDGLEPEGACINNRFRNNKFNIGLVPMSLAPITYGPVWVLRNEFSNYYGTGLKFGIAEFNPDGKVYVYHNTMWADSLYYPGGSETMAAVTYYERSDNWEMRNNIFRGTWYAFRHKVPEDMVGHDWDYDNWYTTENEGYFIMHDNMIYENTSTFFAATGLEEHGLNNPPLLLDPYHGDFHLTASSSNVDAGILIPGINDTYLGNSPDIGAYELGSDCRLDLTVYLQGCYNTDNQLMDANIQMQASFPTSEPFTANGYTHINGGGETLDESMLILTDATAIVDWIFVELRSGANPASIVATKSCLLQRDGKIVDTNGNYPIIFENILDPEIYIVLRHRNHLGVRTFNSHPTDSPIIFDFSNSTSLLFGLNPMGTINGKKVLFSGDANDDGAVNSIDKDSHWRIENALPYNYFISKSDFDINGAVNAIDINFYWRPNNTRTEQLD